MPAKIGYAMAVCESKLSLLDGPATVLPSQLGKENDIGRWLGAPANTPLTYPGLLDRIVIHVNTSIAKEWGQVFRYHICSAGLF